MSISKRILVLESSGSVYDAPFKELGILEHDPELIEDCDLVVFTGGEDVSPSLYGDSEHPATCYNQDRDREERAIFNQAYIMAIPMVGICRGAQFLNVMNNGLLVQHIQSHNMAGTHPINLKDGEIVQVTSTHHQMMIPDPQADILGWTEALSPLYESGGSIDIIGAMSHLKLPNGNYIEPDIVWWPNTRSLGVQYHPEYMNSDSQGWTLFQELLDTYILNP